MKTLYSSTMIDGYIKSNSGTRDVIADYLIESSQNHTQIDFSEQCSAELHTALSLILRTGNVCEIVNSSNIVFATPWIDYRDGKQVVPPGEPPHKLGQIRLEACLETTSCKLQKINLGKIAIHLVAQLEQKSATLAILTQHSLTLASRNGSFFTASQADVNILRHLRRDINEILEPKDEALEQMKHSDLKSDSLRRRN